MQTELNDARACRERELDSNRRSKKELTQLHEELYDVHKREIELVQKNKETVSVYCRLTIRCL